MHKVGLFVRILDNISEWSGKISSWSVLVLMLLVVFEVLSRRIFNRPTIWTFETITMVYGFHFMMVSAYALLKKSIVSVDLLYDKFSPKVRAILDLVTYGMFFFPFVGGVFYASIPYAALSWQTKEASWSAWAPPLYPIKLVIPIAFGLLLIQGISEIIKRLVFLVKGVEL